MKRDEFGDGMKKFFNVGRFDYLDKIMFASGLGIHVDTMLFDDYLHKKFGEYEDEFGLSMSELIIKEYGKDAKEFIEKFI